MEKSITLLDVQITRVQILIGQKLEAMASDEKTAFLPRDAYLDQTHELNGILQALGRGA